MEDELKFDCFPQGNADEEFCFKRGCCWSYTDKQNVPFCYYPSNYALYSFINVTQLNNSKVNGVVGNQSQQINYVIKSILPFFQIGYLKQTGFSGYPEEIPLLKLIATFETKSRLRVKIVDAENMRYEVNVLDNLQTEEFLPVHDYDYTFSVNTDITGFSIARKSNFEVNLSFFFKYMMI